MSLDKLLSTVATITIALMGCAFIIDRSGATPVAIARSGVYDQAADSDYALVLDKLLPGGEIPPEKFPKNIKWMIIVRILPPFERAEYRFSMKRAYDGGVEVSVDSPKGASIFRQITALRKKYPNASIKTLSESVSMEQRTIRRSADSALGQLAHDLEAISLSPTLPDELRVDDTGYEFWCQSLWGNRMNVRLSGPGVGAKDQPHPLLQWAEAVRSALANVPTAN